MSLWVPASEQNRQLEGQRQFLAQILSQGETLERVRYWNKELKAIDPYVEVFKADDTARHPSLKPGYYHLLRRPPVGHPAVVIHQGPDGEFRDLDSGILDTLRQSDMWSDERQRDRAKKMRQAKQAHERAQEREREARLDEISDRFRAKNNPSVLIKRDI